MTEAAPEQLIDSLCRDLKPCKKLRHPCKCVFGWAMIALLYTATVVALLGLRPDLIYRFHEPAFIFEMGLSLAMGASAALATGWMRFPDIRGRAWISAVPYTLLAVFIGWHILRMFFEGAAPDAHWQCVLNAVLLGLGPIAAIVMMTRQGTTVCPCGTAAMNALAVAGLGYAALMLTCPDDAAGHDFVFHFLPFVALGLALGALARRLFRW